MTNRDRYIDLQMESVAETRARVEGQRWAQAQRQTVVYPVRHPRIPRKRASLDFTVGWIGIGMLCFAAAAFLVDQRTWAAGLFVGAICLMAWALGAE